MLAAIRVGNEMLATVLKPANRMVDLGREPAERDLLGAQQALVTEAASHIRRDDTDLAVLEPETFAQAGLHRVRELGRRDEREIAQSRIAKGDDAAPFHREHAVPRGADLLADLDGGAFGEIVIPPVLAKLDKNVVAPLVVEKR